MVEQKKYNPYADLSILDAALKNKKITKKVRDKIEKNPNKFIDNMVRMFEEKEMYEFCQFFQNVKKRVKEGENIIKILKFKVV